MTRTVTIYKILGVDQSLNSSGVCLHTIESVNDRDYHSYVYWNVVSRMTRKMEKFSNPWITIEPYEKHTGDDYVSKELAKTHNIYDIVDILRTIIITEKPDELAIEGISYGSAGSASLVDLAGLNYCIRMLAIEYGLKLNIVSPMSLKKLATGNGGATKDEMVWAWKHCDPNIAGITDIKIDDLADAFFLSRSNEIKS